MQGQRAPRSHQKLRTGRELYSGENHGKDALAVKRPCRQPGGLPGSPSTFRGYGFLKTLRSLTIPPRNYSLKSLFQSGRLRSKERGKRQQSISQPFFPLQEGPLSTDSLLPIQFGDRHASSTQ